ncbi:MAG: hypothetical protein Kow00127_22130 [Bacteroidales bacterium]
MQAMKKIIFVSALLMISSILSAQTTGGALVSTGNTFSSTISTDYQCLGLNPANLGWKDDEHFVHFDIGELGFSVYAEPLDRKLVNQLFTGSEQFGRKEKQEAAQKFSNKDVIFNGGMDGLGLSFQDASFGGVGFHIREKVMWESTLSEATADLMFNGYYSPYFDSISVSIEGDTTGWATVPKLVSQILGNTRVTLMQTREYNLSYGYRVLQTKNFSLYAGAGAKYIEGYNAFSIDFGSGDNVIAFSAINPALGIHFGESPSRIDNERYQPVGKGWGFDAGLSALIINKFRVVASVTDIGKIKWDGNVYVITDDFVRKAEDNGADNYQFFDLSGNQAMDNLKWGGWEGVAEHTTQLPTNMRFGAAYIHKAKFETGMEFLLPLNDAPGSHDRMISALGFRGHPVKWFRGSLGFVMAEGDAFLVPVGLYFFPFNNENFTWEIGFAIRDITTYFRQDKPTISAGIGVLRFGFGSIPKKKVE